MAPLIPTMSYPAFDHSSSLFLEWFKSLPGATFHPGIRIQDLRTRNAGRGIVTTADIPKDTVLFTIPRQTILSTLTSDLGSRIPGIFAEAPEVLEDVDTEADQDIEAAGPPDSWVGLILVLIYEYLQGDASRWKPYLNVLPTNFDTLMFWSPEELNTLQGSDVDSKIGKEEAENTFHAKVLPVIEEHADVFYPEGSYRHSKSELISLAHQMGSTVMAYAFDLEKDEEEPEQEGGDEWMEDNDGKLLMGMVPMADILNADASFNAHVNHGESALTVTTLKDILAGNEVINYYGPLSNGELLRRYGYITSRHAAYDLVEISWDLVLSALKDNLQLNEATWGQALKEIEEEEFEDTFVIDRDLDEPNSEGEAPQGLTIKHLPTDLQEQVNIFLKLVRKVSPMSIPDKEKRDEISLAAMHQALSRKLAGYPTSADFDLGLLQNPDLSDRERMAVQVRHGEKVLLKEAIELVVDKMGKHALGVSGEPSAKRQKTS